MIKREQSGGEKYWTADVPESNCTRRVLIRLSDTAESHSSPAQGAHLKDQGSCQQENRFRQRDRQGGRWVCYILFSFVYAPILGWSEALFICCCSGSSNILHGQNFNNSQRRCATFNETPMTSGSTNTTSSSNTEPPFILIPAYLAPTSLD